MKIELECKIPLSNRAAMLKRLQTAGACGGGEVFEQNWLFDRGGELFARREILRLRVNNHSASGIVTYKCPAAEGFYKARKEIEVMVEDAEEIRAIFLARGFSAVWYYEKRRMSWELHGCPTVIDTLPFIGDFLEIEAPDEETLNLELNILGLSRQENLRCSYAELWRRYCEEHGMSVQELRFPPETSSAERVI